MRAGARFRRLGTGSVQDDDTELQRVGGGGKMQRPRTAMLSSSHSFPIPVLLGFFWGGEGGWGGGGGSMEKKEREIAGEDNDLGAG